MSRLSIIIPALGGHDLLEAGLVSVLQHRPGNCEVLVVLPQPYDDPYQLHEEVRFLSARQGAGLVECLSVGLAAAEGDIIHTLGAGLEVTDGWTSAPIARFADPRVASVAPLLVLGSGGAPLCSAGVTYATRGARRQIILGEREGSPRVPTLGPELRAGFYRRSTLEEVDALSGEVGDQLADIDLALTLRAAGYRAVFEPAARIVASSNSPGPYGFKRGRGAERLFWRNAPLAGWVRSLFAHPTSWLTDVSEIGLRPALLTQLLGRLMANLEFGRMHHRHAQLKSLAALHAAHEAWLETQGASLHRLRIDMAHRSGAEAASGNADAARSGSGERQRAKAA